MPRVIGNYDICVVKNMPFKADLISRASRMKLLMQYGVGLEGYLSISTKYNYYNRLWMLFLTCIQSYFFFFNHFFSLDELLNYLFIYFLLSWFISI